MPDFIRAQMVQRPAPRRWLTEAAVLSLVPMAVYLGTFAVHFSLLTRYGRDTAMLSGQFRATLRDGPSYNPAARMPFLAKVGEVHDIMRRGNRSLEYVSHPAASPWYTWPIMKHPFALWESTNAPPGTKTIIILLGNPAVWWGGMLAALLGAAMVAVRRWQYGAHTYAVVFLAGAVAINYLPFIPIRRLMYLYHYLFALVFLAALAALLIGVPAGWDRSGENLSTFPNRRSAGLYAGIIALLLIGFVYFLPFTYGWPMSQTAYDARFWVLHPHF